jgi:hypothetical protein
MSTDDGSTDITSFLERVADRVPGIQVLAVYDRDAVLIAKGTAQLCSLRLPC